MLDGRTLEEAVCECVELDPDKVIQLTVEYMGLQPAVLAILTASSLTEVLEAILVYCIEEEGKHALDSTDGWRWRSLAGNLRATLWALGE